MKIREMPTHPDSDCFFFSDNGRRRGYLETTPTHHAMGEPMYKVTMHPPGTVFPPNGYPVFMLFYRNDDGGPGYGRDSRILFDPPADGMYQIRVSDAIGQAGRSYAYRLTARPPRPGFKVRFDPANPEVAQSAAPFASMPIALTAMTPIDIRFIDLPSGSSDSADDHRGRPNVHDFRAALRTAMPEPRNQRGCT